MASLVAVASLAAPAQADEFCIPVADATATTVATPAGTLYVKTTDVAVRNLALPAPTDVWRETNGIAGLQPNSEMACGAEPDFHWVDL